MFITPLLGESFQHFLCHKKITWKSIKMRNRITKYYKNNEFHLPNPIGYFQIGIPMAVTRAIKKSITNVCKALCVL